MKVRLLEGLAGNDYSAAAGDVVECDAAEGKRLVEAGIAELVAAEKKPVSRESKVKSEARGS